MIVHYTYKITDLKTGRSYIGVRSCEGWPIDDLGVHYFSSSTDKKFLNEQKRNPDKFEYSVINIFDTREKANKDEIFLHNLYNVGEDSKFYNKCKATTTGFSVYGQKKSEEHCKKISQGKLKVVDGKTVAQIAGEKAAETAKNTILSNGNSLAKERSLKAAITTKSKGLLKGSKNPRARHIEMYDTNGSLIYQTFGNLQEFCELNNLPYSAIVRSLCNNIPMYSWRYRPGKNIDEYREKYKGWIIKYGDNDEI